MRKPLACHLLCLFLASTSLLAQSYKPGWVVKEDTLKGLIKNRSTRKNALSVGFKSSPSDQLKKYTPQDLQGYEIEGEKKYISQTVSIGKDSMKVFLQVLTLGKINTYYLRHEEK
jgi:hypothetical protein